MLYAPTFMKVEISSGPVLPGRVAEATAERPQRFTNVAAVATITRHPRLILLPGILMDPILNPRNSSPQASGLRKSDLRQAGTPVGGHPELQLRLATNGETDLLATAGARRALQHPATPGQECEVEVGAGGSGEFDREASVQRCVEGLSLIHISEPTRPY